MAVPKDAAPADAAPLPRIAATRYVTPLREGGSLPALMEADDLGMYVVKFRGAGQGRKALAAEVISARLAAACGLAVPALAAVELDPELAAGEPDPEIQDLLRASGGLNLGVDFLPGSVDFDAAAGSVDGELAGRVLWFDALVGNADRSWRNPNMLIWHGRLYLIDHGATLTYQHRWAGAAAAAARPYDASGHALLRGRPQVERADARLAGLVTGEVLAAAAAAVPAEWLEPEPEAGLDSPQAVRAAHVRQLTSRLAARPAWLPGLAEAARHPARRDADRPRPPGWLTRSPRQGSPGPRASAARAGDGERS